MANKRAPALRGHIPTHTHTHTPTHTHASSHTRQETNTGNVMSKRKVIDNSKQLFEKTRRLQHADPLFSIGRKK